MLCHATAALATNQCARSLGQGVLALLGVRGLSAEPALAGAAPTTPPADEVAAFREDMRTFAQDFLAPHAAEIDRLNAFPPEFEFWRKAGEWGLHGELGLLGMRVLKFWQHACPHIAHGLPAPCPRAPRHHCTSRAGRAWDGLPAPRHCHGGDQPRLWGT